MLEEHWLAGFLKMGQSRPFMIIHCVLGTRNRDCRMECVDESTELWRHPLVSMFAPVSEVMRSRIM